jgi:shikimate kinase
MGRIALFGPPGSGKSSIAENISKVKGFKVVEGSKAVIYPIANIKKLPEEKRLLQKLCRISDKAGSVRGFIKTDRTKARNLFKIIEGKYSPDFIAKALHEIYVKNPKYKSIIFSGMRGLKNAEYCRLHNDFVVYLSASNKTVIERLCKDRGYNKRQAERELRNEEKIYKTRHIEKIADLIVDTSRNNIAESAKMILSAFESNSRMCRKCVNTAKNPAVSIDKDGYCNICRFYMKNFDARHLKKELGFLKSLKGSGKGKYDVMVGISGGKDSTAALYTIKNLGFSPLAFTFNLGYLPKSTIPRSKKMSSLLHTDHKVIDIRKYIRDIDFQSYKKTVKFYELPFTLETKIRFKKAYGIGRKHYSIKCKHSPIFVRTCQLCRRMVVRAYYNEALRHGVRAIILGINEWTNLSSAQKNKEYKISGVRQLQPNKNMPIVYVFHLPFILQRNSKKVQDILDKIGWKPPAGEDFIESNSNSCLYARSTERMAKRLLEFHPDSTRLAREVTVGFITKKQALKALGKIHPYKYTPRQVLERAGILNKADT